MRERKKENFLIVLILDYAPCSDNVLGVWLFTASHTTHIQANLLFLWKEVEEGQFSGDFIRQEVTQDCKVFMR